MEGCDGNDANDAIFSLLSPSRTGLSCAEGSSVFLQVTEGETDDSPLLFIGAARYAEKERFYPTR
jgi:hypothetical protein